jgi:indolepyruvate ferredoxin oxidoreductase
MATALLGDAIAVNLFMLGYGFQKGLIPLGLDALRRAIELNGVSVKQSLATFAWGRRAAADWTKVAEIARPALRETKAQADDLASLAARRAADLEAYQDAAYAARYRALVADASKAEGGASDTLAKTVAQNFYKLMAYKDEYEVARLSLLPEAADAARARFGPSARMSYRLHPPILRTLGLRRKITLGPWFRAVFAALVIGRRLRGTPLDPFGYTRVRRIERGLVSEYREIAETLIRDLSSDNVALAAQIADLPDLIRGYEGVKLANVDRYHAQTAELLARYALTAAGTDDLSPAGER